MNNKQIRRLQAKTPQQRFLRVLEQEFHYAPKVAQALLEEAETCLGGIPGSLRPGQVRVILTKREAGHGQTLRDAATTEVLWTVDAGVEDQQVLQRHGRIALRHVRIQRLLDEALGQEAVATQEDLTRALQVSLRTIKQFVLLRYPETRGGVLPTKNLVSDPSLFQIYYTSGNSKLFILEVEGNIINNLAILSQFLINHRGRNLTNTPPDVKLGENLRQEEVNGRSSSSSSGQLFDVVQTTVQQTKFCLFQWLYCESPAHGRSQNDEPRGRHLLLGGPPLGQLGTLPG